MGRHAGPSRNGDRGLIGRQRNIPGAARIRVTDRADVVVELREPGVAYAQAAVRHALFESWARAGVVTLPARPKAPLPSSPVRQANGSSKRLLDADRSERRR